MQESYAGRGMDYARETKMLHKFYLTIRRKRRTGWIYSGPLHYNQSSLHWNVISFCLFNCFDSLYAVLILRNKRKTSFFA